MALVYLVRHGQASFGAEDYDVLSELGHHQARVVGEELRRRGVQPSRVLSGTLRRQRDTAKAALEAAKWGLACETDERWNEYDHEEVLLHHGTPPPEPSHTQSVLDGALDRWADSGKMSACTENWPTFESRVVAALSDITTRSGRGDCVVVFTSGGVIGALCARLLGLGDAAFLGFNRVAVNAALTKIVHGRSGTNVVSFNDHAHFEADHAHQLTYR
jgi:broad specificity phosphatase PhoE